MHVQNNNKPKNQKISRRDFIGSVAAAAAFTIVPRHVLGGAGHTPPSEKLNIAAVGAGGMGRSNIKNCSGENIVALCDVDDERAAETYKLHPNAKKYRDFRKMLEKQKDIDAVIVATPDHTHATIAMEAMRMGKHVYVQKPLTRTVYEARMLTEAAHKYKVVTQMGNQGHSGEGVRLICEWIWDGAIGPVREVLAWTNRPIWPQGIDRPEGSSPVPSTLDWDLWLGPAPYRPYVDKAYLPFAWRGWWDFGCGALGDMACHLLDPIVHYKFPSREGMPPVKMTWYDGGLKPERPEELEPGRKMRSVVFVGDKGKLMSGEYGDSPRLIPETKMKEYNRPPKTILRVEGSHEQNWIDACKNGTQACSNFDYAGPMTETIVMGNLAIRNPGQKLEWDGENMKVTNVPEANQYVNEPYREGWTL
ncbi:MAG: Gfo/Idh/MocA family protein [Planctomycetota bacterium]|jgi:hypothetical protein